MTQPATVPDAPPFVSGFISILGRPNAGKSTLLNALLGAKLAIVADKPQTTRNAIQGVLTGEDAQMVFLDTPGIHKPTSRLNRRMMEMVREALDQRDVLVYVVDATRRVEDADREAVALVAAARTPTLLVLNKIDRLKDKSPLLALIEQYKTMSDFEAYLPVSAVTGEGLDLLRGEIRKRLPAGPAYFPSDHLTDQPERFLAAELIRERIIRATREEVPHSVAVVIELWEEKPKVTRIAAAIVVERSGQKGILIGAGGRMLKQVGTEARLEIERLLGRRIFLELFVKVQPGWRDNQAFLRELERQAIPSAGVPDSPVTGAE
jgi:GTPase